MKLGKIKVSYPIVAGNARITYSQERKPAAIEWLLVEIIKKIDGNKEYANTTIDSIIQNIFLINDTKQLIHPCIRELVELGIIDIDDCSMYVLNCSLQEVCCERYHLTELGKKFQEQGTLPGAKNEILQYFQVNVATDDISMENKGATDQPLGIALAEQENINYDSFDDKIYDFLNTAKGKKVSQLGWLESGTQINNIISDPYIKWNNEDIVIMLEKGMNIAFPNLTSEMANKIADNLAIVEDSAPDYLNKDFLEHISVEDPNNVFNKVIDKSNIISNINNFSNGKDVVIVTANIKEVMNPKKEPQKIICIDDTCIAPEICKKENGTVEIILPPQHEYIKFLYADSQHKLYCGTFKMHYNDIAINKIYGYTLKHDALSFDETIKILISDNYKQCPGIIVLLNELGDSGNEIVFEYVKKIITSHINDDIKTISSILESIDRANKLYTGKNYFTKNSLSKVFPQEYSITLNSNISVDEFVIQLEVLHGYWLIEKMPNILKKYVLDYISNIKQPILAEIYVLFKYLQENESKIMSSIIAENTYLKLYTPLVIKQLFLSYGENDFSSNQDITPIEHEFHKLKQSLLKIRKVLDQVEWSDDIDQELVLKYILEHKEKIATLKNNIKSWDTAIINLHTLIPEIDIIQPTTCKFTEDAIIIAKIKEAIDPLNEISRDNYKKVYIVDTCVLINKPDIIHKFKDGKALLVIPMMVLEELDKHKENRQNPELQYFARQAIKTLDLYSDEKWLDKNESADIRLLPQEYQNKTGDNKILSTALKFLLKKPTIISDDVNFRNKAESLKLKTISSDEFCSMKSV